MIWRGKTWTLAGTIDKIDGATYSIDGTQVAVDDHTNLRGDEPAVGRTVIARGKGSPGDPLVASSITVLKEDSSSPHYGVDYLGRHERADG